MSQAYNFQLRFEQIGCPRCGVPRQKALACECGATGDADSYVDLRRSIIGAAAAQLRTLPSASGAIVEPLIDFQHWSQWLNQLMVLLVTIVGDAAEPQLGEPLFILVSELQRARADIVSAEKFRPWMLHWRASEDVLDGLAELAVQYLEAFSTDDLRVAERLGQEGQRALDGIAERLDRVSFQFQQYSGILSSEDDSIYGPLYAIVKVAASGAMGDVAVLDRLGTELFYTITGHRECPMGLGAILAATDLEVTTRWIGDVPGTVPG